MLSKGGNWFNFILPNVYIHVSVALWFLSVNKVTRARKKLTCPPLFLSSFSIIVLVGFGPVTKSLITSSSQTKPWVDNSLLINKYFRFRLNRLKRSLCHLFEKAALAWNVLNFGDFFFKTISRLQQSTITEGSLDILRLYTRIQSTNFPRLQNFPPTLSGTLGLVGCLTLSPHHNGQHLQRLSSPNRC